MGRAAFVSFVVVMTAHIPLAHFCGWSLHWVIAGFALAIFMLEANYADPRLRVFYWYVALVLIAGVLSLRYQPAYSVALGLSSYLSLQTVIVLGLARNTNARIAATVTAVKYLGILATIVAFYQFFLDPTLFGLYEGTSFADYSNWSIPRSPSYFRSTQVFAAFTVFAIILIDIFERRKSLIPSWQMAIILIGGLLSGSSALVICLSIYYTIKATRRAPALLVIMPILGALSYIILLLMGKALTEVDISSPLARSVAVLGMGDIETGNDERIAAWVHALQDSPLLGNGIGSASTLVDGAERYNTESYWLSLNYEGGVILVSALIIVVAWSFATAVRYGTIEMVAGVVTFAFYAMIVHAFYAWALPIVWLLIFGIFMSQAQLPSAKMAVSGNDVYGVAGDRRKQDDTADS